MIYLNSQDNQTFLKQHQEWQQNDCSSFNIIQREIGISFILGTSNFIFIRFVAARITLIRSSSKLTFLSWYYLTFSISPVMSLNIQCLKHQEFHQRKWNLHNVLSPFFQSFNGTHIIILCKCPKLFMQFDDGVEFSLSIQPITKSFKGFYHWFVGWTPKCLSTCP